jgi:hypothetical protein
MVCQSNLLISETVCEHGLAEDLRYGLALLRFAARLLGVRTGGVDPLFPSR